MSGICVGNDKNNTVISYKLSLKSCFSFIPLDLSFFQFNESYCNNEISNTYQDVEKIDNSANCYFFPYGYYNNSNLYSLSCPFFSNYPNCINNLTDNFIQKKACLIKKLYEIDISSSCFTNIVYALCSIFYQNNIQYYDFLDISEIKLENFSIIIQNYRFCSLTSLITVDLQCSYMPIPITFTNLNCYENEISLISTNGVTYCFNKCNVDSDCQIFEKCLYFNSISKKLKPKFFIIFFIKLIIQIKLK